MVRKAKSNVTKRRVELVKISPTVAKKWLEKNKNFRRRKAALVEKYRKDMSKGFWTDSPDCIAFNEAGDLVNGQHRLEGCIASGKAFEAVVFWGMKINADLNADTGSVRQLRDYLTYKGEKNANLLASVLRSVYAYRLDGSPGWAMYRPRGGYPSITELLALLAKEGSLRQTVSMVASHKSTKALLPGSILGGVYHIFREKDVDFADEFFEYLSGRGDMSKEGDPFVVLVKKLQKSIDPSVGRMTYNASYAICIKAWNAKLRGQQCNILRWGKAERGPDFPKILGLDD